VILGVDGRPDFDALHGGKQDHEAQFYAFDVLALDEEDLRGLSLSMRKTNLARLLTRRPDGIFIAPFEQGEIGPDLFRAACNMGLEAWYRSDVIGPIAPAGRLIRSRSRTRVRPLWCGLRKGVGELPPHRGTMGCSAN
jgi:hypothetical protein